MALPGKFILPVFFLIILLGTIILGPLVYFSVNLVFPIPFHRAMDRALVISTVAALGVFWQRIPLARLWPWNSDAWKQLLLGYFIAAVSIQAMIGFYLAAVGFSTDHLGAAEIAKKVALALVAALLVPPLEETIFRGFLQQEFGQLIGWRAGWLITAAFYTLAHFLKISWRLDNQPVHLWSGATALGGAFAGLGQELAHPGNIGKALNLFLVGVVLGGIFLRSGTLWLNAGLHSGWIFGLLLFTWLTQPPDSMKVAGTDPILEWFRGDILSSWVTSVVLVLLGIWLWRFYRHPSISPETGADAP